MTTGAGPHAGGKGAKRIPVALVDMTRSTPRSSCAAVAALPRRDLAAVAERRAGPRPERRPWCSSGSMVAQGIVGLHPVLHPPAGGAGRHPCPRGLDGVGHRALVPPRALRPCRPSRCPPVTRRPADDAAGRRTRAGGGRRAGSVGRSRSPSGAGVTRPPRRPSPARRGSPRRGRAPRHRRVAQHRPAVAGHRLERPHQPDVLRDLRVPEAVRLLEGEGDQADARRAPQGPGRRVVRAPGNGPSSTSTASTSTACGRPWSRRDDGAR